MEEKEPTFMAPFGDVWVKAKCPCGTVNWLCGTNEDTEKVKCWQCGNTHWIDEYAYEMSSGAEPVVVDGLQQPRI